MQTDIPVYRFENADVMTGDEMYFNVVFTLIGGVAKVFQNRNNKVAEAKVLSAERTTTSRLYRVVTDSGVWEVVKLKCKCTDPEKSGRLWS